MWRRAALGVAAALRRLRAHVWHNADDGAIVLQPKEVTHWVRVARRCAPGPFTLCLHRQIASSYAASHCASSDLATSSISFHLCRAIKSVKPMWWMAFVPITINCVLRCLLAAHQPGDEKDRGGSRMCECELSTSSCICSEAVNRRAKQQGGWEKGNYGKTPIAYQVRSHTMEALLTGVRLLRCYLRL